MTQLSLFDFDNEPVAPKKKKKEPIKKTAISPDAISVNGVRHYVFFIPSLLVSADTNTQYAGENVSKPETLFAQECTAGEHNYIFFIPNRNTISVVQETKAEAKAKEINDESRPTDIKKELDEYFIENTDIFLGEENSFEVGEDKETIQTTEKDYKDVPSIRKRGRKSFKEMDLDATLVDVPDDEILYQKQYYSITEVAKWFHVNSSLLRFWENEFSILKPRKNKKGDRLFRPEDIKNLQVIYYLLRQKKYTIDGARKYLKANKATADKHVQVMQSLSKFKKFLLEIKASIS